MKKLLSALLALALLAGCTTAAPKTDDVKKLPAPVNTAAKYKNAEGNEVACEANNYTNACAGVNSTNLHEFLGRDDVIYIDLRDYVDYGSKHLRNFEVIPYFAYIFNAEAGTNPAKIQLFGGTVKEPVAAYEESVEILEVLFPKDKTIFLMCQSGGRVAQAMTLLDSLGWDMSKIYNVGGMGQYTDAAYAGYTTNAAELKVQATYSFEGLTPVKK